MGDLAVITGATSGIGAAFAAQFAAKGYDLLLCGRREAKIRKLAADLAAAHGIKTEVVLAELSNEQDVSRLLSAITVLNPVTALVNSAGFGMAGYFTENPDANMNMLAVHVIAPLKLIAAVAPVMKGRRKGIIINVSSVAAFFPMAKGATYSATKKYLNTFSESLYMELRPFGISVQALCPGMTRTDFHSRDDEGREVARRYFLRWMKPETVARKSLNRIDRKTVVYVPGLLNKFLARVVSHLPRRLYYRLAARI